MTGKINIIKPKEIQLKKSFIDFIKSKKEYVFENPSIRKKTSFMTWTDIGYLVFYEDSIKINILERNLKDIENLFQKFIIGKDIVINIVVNEDSNNQEYY